MKVLFVGDIHNHTYMFDDIKKLDNEHHFDRIICTGDYVDDWLTDNHRSLETLNSILELKKKEPDKYTLLLGNHEVSYLGFPCSGHHYELEDVMNRTLVENISCFEYFTEVELGKRTYVCSHAGFTNDYICQVLDVFGDWKPVLEDLQKEKIKNLPYLKYCSRYRGGNDTCSSFIWTDRMEIVEATTREKPLVPYQVIGHSSISTVGNAVGETFDFYFIDTHSTYRDGTPFGDKSYLMWDEDKFNILYGGNGNV